jgi:hypothetical protein
MPLFMSSFYSKPETKPERDRILATPLVQLARVDAGVRFIDLTITFSAQEGAEVSVSLRTPTVRVHLANN